MSFDKLSLRLARSLEELDTTSNKMNGYLSYATWTPTEKSIGSFKASWRVPLAPKKKGHQTLFLFMGMETADRTLIFQPVLEWGPSPGAAKEESHWSVACYLVNGSPGNLSLGAKTKSVPVSVCDLLEAEISLNSTADGLFGYSCEFKEIVGCGLYIQSPLKFTQAGVALEVSNVSDTAALPASTLTQFENLEIVLDDGSKSAPDWQITNLAAQYGVRAYPIDHRGIKDEIDIQYR